MFDKLLDLYDVIRYDLLHQEAPVMPKFDPNIRFKLKKSKEGYWVQSDQLPGFIASGKTLEELREAMWDTMLTYYNVPRYKANRLEDRFELRLSDGKEIKPPEKNFVVRVICA